MAFDPKPASQTRTSMIETISLVVIILIVSWFFVKPQTAVLSQEKTQLEQAKINYQRVGQDQTSLDQLVTRLKESQPDIALIDEALPMQNRTTNVEVLLDSLVTASGMHIVDMSILPPDKDTVNAGDKTTLTDPYGVVRKLQTMLAEVRISGDLEQLKNLLQLIETNGRVLDVTALDMSNDQGNPTFKLKLKAYSYVP